MSGLPPIVKATLQAAAINASSNIVGQAISAYRTEIPFQLNYTTLAQFTTVAIINTPIAYLWMTNLEASFPAHGDSTTRPGTALSEKQKEKKDDNISSKSPPLNIKNTVLKVVLDQTVGSVVMNILFLSSISLLRGGGPEDILESIRNEFWQIFTAGLAVWPIASLLNFTVVPADQRLLVGSLFGFFWAIYLSLVTSS